MKLDRGNPGAGVGTVMILATNPNMRIRGLLAEQLSVTIGPLLQIKALEQSPQSLGSIVRATVLSSAYATVYFAVAYPVEATNLQWGAIEDTLVRALEVAQQDAHKDIVVPYFFDAPYLHKELYAPQIVEMMKRVFDLFPDLNISFMCWEDYQYEAAQALYAPSDTAIDEKKHKSTKSSSVNGKSRKEVNNDS